MLNERIDPNSIVGSGRVTRYLFAALSTSFYRGGFGPVRLYTTVVRLIESRWFDTSATVYLSAANPAGGERSDICRTRAATGTLVPFLLRFGLRSAPTDELAIEEYTGRRAYSPGTGGITR
jgi:hypothetical protein